MSSIPDTQPSAISVLFATDYWWHKEVLHQMVLSLLFDHTNLAQCIGGPSCRLSGPSKAEAVERRAFDLQLPLENNRKINIELKLNAALSEQQIKRQLSAADPADAMWYLLLGGSAHCWWEERIYEHHPSAKRIDLPKLLNALENCTLNNGADPGIEQLLTGYMARLKQHEQLIYKSYEDKPLAQWDYFAWAAFYGAIHPRGWQIHKSMESGNFWVCGLNWINIDENVDIALELEQNTGLCFKIKVKKTEQQTYLRNLFFECLQEADGEKIRRPKRFGKGGWMTGAVYLHNLELIRQIPDGLATLQPYAVDWDYFYIACEDAEKILQKAASILQTKLK